MISSYRFHDVRRLSWQLLAGVLAAVMLSACERNDEQAARQAVDSRAEPDGPQPSEDVAVAAAPMFDLVVTDYAISAPDEVRSGWTTFRLVNEGRQTHFVIFYRMPDGKTIADQKREVVPHFDAVMAGLESGELDREAAAQALGERIPEWAFTVKYRGGPGLVAPGEAVETTILLDEPGTYLLECYVKAPDGTFHTSMGMLRQMQVTAPRNGAAEPEADLELTLSNAGIAMSGDPVAGRNVFRVNYAEDPQAFMPYDVHLARLDEETDMEELVQWMDWMNPQGLRAPAPVQFLGGAENTPAGNHAYLAVDIEPGRYAWISEIDASRMLQEFTVE